MVGSYLSLISDYDDLREANKLNIKMDQLINLIEIEEAESPDDKNIIKTGLSIKSEKNLKRTSTVKQINKNNDEVTQNNRSRTNLYKVKSTNEGENKEKFTSCFNVAYNDFDFFNRQRSNPDTSQLRLREMSKKE